MSPSICNRREKDQKYRARSAVSGTLQVTLGLLLVRFRYRLFPINNNKIVNYWVGNLKMQKNGLGLNNVLDYLDSLNFSSLSRNNDNHNSSIWMVVHWLKYILHTKFLAFTWFINCYYTNTKISIFLLMHYL